MRGRSRCPPTQIRATGPGKTDCPTKADSSVVLHEYGHAVDDELGGIHNAPLSEGLGDALSMLFTGSNIIGPRAGARLRAGLRRGAS